MGKIFYLMGKSSSGKDTIFKELQQEFPQMQSVTLYTTRPIREGEVNGREYFFVAEEELNNFTEAGQVIELRSYDTMHGVWKYFTVDDGQIDLNVASYLVIGTLESYAAMTAYFGGDQVIPIYIEVEDGERLSRAVARERREEFPKYAEVCRRFLADAVDFSEENLVRTGINKRFDNSDIKLCRQEIGLYIQASL